MHRQTRIHQRLTSLMSTHNLSSGMYPDDGYTELLYGQPYRRMLSPQRDACIKLAKVDPLHAINIVFNRPYFFGSRDALSSQQQQDLFRAVFEYSAEQTDLRNLITGAKLRMSHPKLADLSCNTCRKWWIDADTYEICRIGGDPLSRPAHAELMCDTETGCPKGHWSDPLSLSDKNTKTWNYYWEWQTVGCPFPDCPIIRRNWKYLNWVISNGSSRRLRPTIH